jgi:hypothetical protein
MPRHLLAKRGKRRVTAKVARQIALKKMSPEPQMSDDRIRRTLAKEGFQWVPRRKKTWARPLHRRRRLEFETHTLRNWAPCNANRAIQV